MALAPRGAAIQREGKSVLTKENESEVVSLVQFMDPSSPDCSSTPVSSSPTFKPSSGSRKRSKSRKNKKTKARSTRIYTSKLNKHQTTTSIITSWNSAAALLVSSRVTRPRPSFHLGRRRGPRAPASTTLGTPLRWSPSHPSPCRCRGRAGTRRHPCAR